MEIDVQKLLMYSTGWNSLGTKGAAEISRGLQANATLLDLDLSRNGLGDSGASHMGYALTENQGLKQLNLSSNGIESKACTVSTHKSTSFVCICRMEIHSG